ncbi:hypothetical protein A3B85_03370 [Candidatus Nomurabacteria bacterium RIFCSPHIGHO2_02_FULL_37_13]|uniref:Uncharacterized protein n=1 Tax=Candidatus Nomurabacteria bacterium RIFCSPHIGHO2_02_FULL_37_13 TaxID=1801750 RepID=A0A1F6W7F3_9BACT|nr:MAG: hypothetical protein A2640_01065 [Candidatus Nomurabacteria bacterium RIFCSPHIGHO2_01_FULL_36_23]OGI77774.1 MAG: hypothetical protein A3B85_03370 [Candidatus Nomurabacteria bacterium RIFCSPHIGHO2_02_FULL_37_13]OGI87675.1 MAG: hypothetical protein A2906_00240 [Candidatus Nomurabacteria bacterium RIFCSPLOWO2_01_FULL_37_25]
MISKKKKIIAIDELAVMVAKGFEGVDRKLEEASRNMARVENNLLYHIGSINRRLDDISFNKVKYEDHDALKKRVSILEKV